MSHEWNISVCGLNCTSCDFYKAGIGDKKKQQEIIQWFKNDYGKEITPEQTRCKGCRGQNEPHWSPDCVLKNCAKEKRVTHCNECNEFVCEKLDNFANDGHKSHKSAVERLKQIKEIGLNEWVVKQN